MFNIKQKITGQTGNNSTKNVEIIVTLKYLSNFCRAFEMPLINCEFKLSLNWSENCVLMTTKLADQATIFLITDTSFMFQY